MTAVKERVNQFLALLNDELGRLLKISFGIFLFILFFQPFHLDPFDFNNRLLIIAGLGGIVFLLLIIVQVIVPWFVRIVNRDRQEPVLLTVFNGFIILALSSVAFAFYLHFVGYVEITFYLMLKVSLICLSVPVALRFSDLVKDLRQQNETLIIEKKLQKHVEEAREDDLKKSIELFAENNTESITLIIADVVFIKSADNYVEIVYKTGDHFRKKLLRNTMKNIEQQLNPYSNFIRCHRICIVNTYYIEKLNRTYNNHWLTIKEYDEQIPVSRQYLLKFKTSF
ncbi:MAG TPA: LytTR family DNA-binding domain-containing protein [Bacteroidales bacterium]|nr:LytTR family DNA-binding domain-containing protein [Bacteroidales bacterium]